MRFQLHSGVIWRWVDQYWVEVEVGEQNIQIKKADEVRKSRTILLEQFFSSSLDSHETSCPCNRSTKDADNHEVEDNPCPKKEDGRIKATKVDP